MPIRLLVTILLFLSGCSSLHKQVALVDSATVEAEPHVIWTRPLELGFEMGRYIEGSSSTSRFMGCFRTGGDAVVRPTVTVMGASDNLTPAAQLAVSNAVKESNADGMYILFVEESSEWNGLIKETTTQVRGRALKLEDFGSVDQERATKARLNQGGDQ